jgi:DNA (cytosine-5)-methyltransferase 1
MSHPPSGYPEALAAAWADHLAPRADDAPTVISTFAGTGGSSLGYSMAGYRELLAVEWDNHAAACFRLNFPGVPLYHGDIAKLSVARVLDRTGLAVGELDVFDGSPPCQGFSTSGNRDFGDARNRLFEQFARLLEGLQPRAFVMENVSGMVAGPMKLTFVDCLRTLKKAGYRVSARILDARYHGVPQMRRRLIFVGAREDLGVEPTHPRGTTWPIGVREAWRGIPDVPGPPTGPRAACWASTILPGTNNGDGRYSRPMLGKKIGFNACRLHWDRPSPTLTKTHASSAPFLHPERPLARITIEQAKRIGSFPDAFAIPGAYTAAWARIGNSVPPLLMRAVAAHVRATILGR